MCASVVFYRELAGVETRRPMQHTSLWHGRTALSHMKGMQTQQKFTSHFIFLKSGNYKTSNEN